jgi:hypothetical protein
MLAQELRVNLSENVPGSHIFSLNDIARSHKLANCGRELYRLVRIVSGRTGSGIRNDSRAKNTDYR